MSLICTSAENVWKIKSNLYLNKDYVLIPSAVERVYVVRGLTLSRRGVAVLRCCEYQLVPLLEHYLKLRVRHELMRVMRGNYFHGTSSAHRQCAYPFPYALF